VSSASSKGAESPVASAPEAGDVLAAAQSGLLAGLARCLDRVRTERGRESPAVLAVGLSGGGDSAALLGLLCRLSPDQWRTAGWTAVPRLVAVHCHHGMTAASPALERAARATAATLGVPVEVLVLAIPPSPGESPEALARLHRYRALGEWLPAESWLLTAHHADDQAETLLLQAFRGAGLEGLAAMPWQAAFGHGVHARPLLGVSRAVLRDALATLGLGGASFVVEDPMNVDPHLDRAYLRSAVWPLLAARWPGVNLTLSRAAGHLQDALRVVDAAVEMDLAPLLQPLGSARLPRLAATALDLEGLRALPLARRAQVVRAWVRREGHRSPPSARVGTLVGQMLEARGDATPCVQWGPSEIHAWRGRYYLGTRSAASLAERLAAAASPPPPWRRELPRMSGWALLPEGSGLDLGAAGRLRLEAARTGHRLRIEPGMAFLVRGRVGGERLRLRPGTVAVHQEVRKLLQGVAVPPWLRDEVPMLWTVPAVALAAACAAYGEGELVAVGDWFLDAARLATGEEVGWRVVWERPFA